MKTMKTEREREREREREHKWLFNAVNEGDGLKLLDWMKQKQLKVQLAFLDPQYKATKGTTFNYYYLDDSHPPHHDQDSEQIKQFCHKIAEVLKEGGWLCLWINQSILLSGEFKHWLPKDLIIKHLLVWVKGKDKELHSILGQSHSHFISKEEYCIVARKKPFSSPVLKKRTANIFNHFFRSTAGRHNIHIKPYKMLKAIIKQITEKGDLVIDTCAGNFGVLVACQATDRQFLGCDISVGETLRFNINKENTKALLQATKSEATSEKDLKKYQPRSIKKKEEKTRMEAILKSIASGSDVEELRELRKLQKQKREQQKAKPNK